MEKRLIIAVLLSVGVLYAYSFLFPTPKPLQPGTSAPKQAALSSAAKPGAEPTSAASAPASAATASQLAAAGQPTTAASARDITVDTDLFTAVFSTQGAGLKKLVLK